MIEMAFFIIVICLAVYVMFKELEQGERILFSVPTAIMLSIGFFTFLAMIGYLKLWVILLFAFAILAIILFVEKKKLKFIKNIKF